MGLTDWIVEYVKEKVGKKAMDVFFWDETPEIKKEKTEKIEAVEKESTQERWDFFASMMDRLTGKSDSKEKEWKADKQENSWFGNEGNGTVYNGLDSIVSRTNPDANMRWDLAQRFDGKFLGNKIPGKVNKFEAYTATTGLAIKFSNKIPWLWWLVDKLWWSKIKDLMTPLLEKTGWIFKKLSKIYPRISKLADKWAKWDLLSQVQVLRIIAKDKDTFASNVGKVVLWWWALFTWASSLLWWNSDKKEWAEENDPSILSMIGWWEGKALAA